MTWLQRYRVRHYLRNSIWVLPVFAMAAAVNIVRVLHRLDEATGWQSAFQPDTMRAVLGTLAGSMFTFIVFVCSSLLLVVQLASAQLTPRIIGVLFKDSVTKITLALFVFMFTFAIAALVRIGATVPLLTAEIAVWSTAGCICVFLYLIDHVGKMLRPSGALLSVATQAHDVIESVYPQRLKTHETFADYDSTVRQSESTSIIKSSHDGVVLAFDVQGLVMLAVRYDCVIEFVPQVGNLVAPGDALFRIHGGAGLPAKALKQSVALGMERTMEQDPLFPFRVIVDIASKGLSPAINDPTTAVLALDRLHHLLRHIGCRRLDDEKIRDASGRVRLLYHTPDWDDFVRLAVTEIRQFGGSSIQVARRLRRAMLENLIETLPEERAEPLRRELKLLKKTAERFFQEPEDRALATSVTRKAWGEVETGTTDLPSSITLLNNAKEMRPLTPRRILYETVFNWILSGHAGPDKKSQRAAWVVSGKSRPIMETGVYNLTKDTAPALLHVEDGQTQQWLLVRMDEPKQ